MGRIAADPPDDGPVLLLRLLALQEGPSLVGDWPCHTTACAGRLACWQCCHWSEPTGASSISARSWVGNLVHFPDGLCRSRGAGLREGDELGGHEHGVGPSQDGVVGCMVSLFVKALQGVAERPKVVGDIPESRLVAVQRLK